MYIDDPSRHLLFLTLPLTTAPLVVSADRSRRRLDNQAETSEKHCGTKHAYRAFKILFIAPTSICRRETRMPRTEA